MPRPHKKRRISSNIEETYFKPAGIKKRELDMVELYPDEYHAINLIYIDNLDQIKAAEKMNVSQPTFSRILNSGIKKISEAIIKIKVIKIKKI